MLLCQNAQTFNLEGSLVRKTRNGLEWCLGRAGNNGHDGLGWPGVTGNVQE